MARNYNVEMGDFVPSSPNGRKRRCRKTRFSPPCPVPPCHLSSQTSFGRLGEKGKKKQRSSLQEEPITELVLWRTPTQLSVNGSWRPSSPSAMTTSLPRSPSLCCKLPISDVLTSQGYVLDLLTPWIARLKVLPKVWYSTPFPKRSNLYTDPVDTKYAHLPPVTSENPHVHFFPKPHPSCLGPVSSGRDRRGWHGRYSRRGAMTVT